MVVKYGFDGIDIHEAWDYESKDGLVKLRTIAEWLKVKPQQEYEILEGTEAGFALWPTCFFYTGALVYPPPSLPASC
jgi:hypothetical protein